MKNLIKFMLFIALTYNISAQDKVVIELSGAISEKYPVIMLLVIQNENVMGYYYYEKYETKILLAGHVDGTKITLNESPDYETEFKKGFIGVLDEQKFKGSWIDKISNKELAFEAWIDSDYILEVDEETAGVEGIYESIYNSDTYSASVDFKNIIDDLFVFEISNGSQSGCSGYLKGLIELNNLSSGSYSDDSCEELIFTVDMGAIIVNESNCEWHGMRCPFNGEYRKK